MVVPEEDSGKVSGKRKPGGLWNKPPGQVHEVARPACSPGEFEVEGGRFVPAMMTGTEGNTSFRVALDSALSTETEGCRSDAKRHLKGFRR